MQFKVHAGVSKYALCAALALTADATAAQVQQTAATNAATTIQEVIVTAAKRETTLQRTPQAVSVLSGAVQRDKGETGLTDLATTVPNVNFAYTSNTSQIYIRGIGDTFIAAGGDPGVAFYQDNAYVSDATTNNTALFDVERVEVLSGPQGALYGRNAVGGAINVLSAKPADSFHAAVDVVGGDYGRLNSEGYISGPLGVANTAVRVSYQSQSFDGYTKNLLGGQQFGGSGPTAPDRFDDQHTQAFRIQSLTNLPNQGTLRIILSHYHEADNGAGLAITPQPGIVYPAQAIYGDAPSSDPRSVYANVGGYGLDVSTANVSLAQPIGADTLTVLANYRDGHQTFLNDCDGTPADSCTYYRDTHSQDYFGDIHIASPNADRVRWLVGASVLRFNQQQYTQVVYDSLAAYFVPGAPASEAFPLDSVDGGSLRVTSYAAYADLRLRLTPIWAVAGQVRYSETTKDATQFLILPQFGLNITGYTGPGSALKNTSLPFKLGVEGQLTSQILVYSSYTTAEKDGAINLGSIQPAPVKPETVRSFEVGEKASFLDRRLQVNSAVFDSDYDDLQISHVFNTSVILANAPRANIKGAEIEIVALPLQGLQLSFNGGYLDAKFKQFSNGRVLPGAATGPLINLAGHDLPYVSPTTLNFDATYRFPVISSYSAAVDLQYSWHDRVYFNEFNDADNSQKAVGLVNLQASVSPDGGPWKLYAYLHNLTNETVETGSTIYAASLGAEKAISYAPPRVFAVGAAYKW
jgi:outer membrane receptor protein involved in Fe transport